MIVGSNHKQLSFPNSGNGWGVNSSQWRESEIFQGEIFLLGVENLRRSEFDYLNLFQSLEQHSVNAEHQLKLELA